MTDEYDPTLIAASYDAVAESYADKLFHELDYKPFDRELLIDIAGRADGVVCDLGCGPGHVARFLAEHGADVIGVDLSQAMVDLARRRNPDLRYEQGNMLDLAGIPDGAWGAVVALYSIIHIDRPRVPEALREMNRVTAPGGLLAVGVHGGTGEIHYDTFLDHDVPFTGTYFQLDELRDLIAAAGFEIESAVERAPYPEEGPTQRLYVIATRGA